jgi:hypothetical protein
MVYEMEKEQLAVFLIKHGVPFIPLLARITEVSDNPGY